MISPRVGEWTASRATPRRTGITASRALSLAAWLVAAAVGVGLYNNVIADDAGLRHRASEHARQHAGCGNQCTVTQMQERRTVFGYEANYDIVGAETIEVTCRRSAIIAGDYRCSAASVHGH